jgi:phosphoribosylformylglycinamidine cyclo-ligase
MICIQEIYKTFNCGIGFVIGVPKNSAYGIVSELNLLGLKADVIGEVKKGSGQVKINSCFSDKQVIL